MTSLVGILCQNGVVIGSDSAATLGQSPHVKTIEIPTRKIDIFLDRVILASSGPVGLNQRFGAVIQGHWSQGLVDGKDALTIGKMLAASVIQDFGSTRVPQGQYGALIGYVGNGQPVLCEFDANMQPELKELDKLWFVSIGSAQPITDPFIAFLRKLFWPEQPPNLEQGLFLAAAALDHAIEMNPGGVNGPIQIAVLEAEEGGQYRARYLDKDEISEHVAVVREAYSHFAQYAERWSPAGGQEIPEP